MMISKETLRKIILEEIKNVLLKEELEIFSPEFLDLAKTQGLDPMEIDKLKAAAMALLGSASAEEAI